MSCEGIDLDVLIVQDTSVSMYQTIADLQAQVVEQLANLGNDFATMRLGLASFTDKPTPQAGWGAREVFQWKEFDFCYQLESPLTDDYERVKTSLKNIRKGDGGDDRENIWEAVLIAALDPKVGWNPDAAKVVVVLTDDGPQSPGDNEYYTEIYNTDLCMVNEDTTLGLPTTIYVDGDRYTAEEFKELCSLYRTQSQDPVRFDELVKKYLPPYKFKKPAPLPHDGEMHIEDCSAYDYPSVEQMNHALEAQGILPAFVLMPPDAGKCIDPNTVDWCEGKWTDEEWCIAQGSDYQLQCNERYYESFLNDVSSKYVLMTCPDRNSTDQIIRTLIDAVKSTLSLNEVCDEAAVAPSHVGLIVGCVLGGLLLLLACLGGALFLMKKRSYPSSHNAVSQICAEDQEDVRDAQAELTPEMFK